MNRSPLDRFGAAVAARPVAALILLLLASLGVSAFALRLERETSFSAFAPSGPVSRSLRAVEEDFGTGGPVIQVMIDTGGGGNVLSPSGLAMADRVATTAAEAVGERAASDAQPVQSFAQPLRLAFERAGIAADAPDQQRRAVIRATLQSPAGGALAGLLSEDLDVDSAQARAGLAVVPLDGGLSSDEAVNAALDIRSAVGALDVDADVRVLGRPLLEHASAELSQQELIRLLSISVVLITVVLVALFRNVADVAIGLVGLALSLAWTYGLGALLGPGWLGLTGPFNLITIIVPVLVAGLGIDFALHLTTRRREERTERGARSSSRRAVATVGGALALTTITTAVGFLTNLASPLPPLGDFGVFTAVGVLSAFVVMLVLVPATREVLDRRREHPDRPVADEPETPLPFVGTIAGFAIAHPVLVLGGTLAITAAALVAATSVGTRFSTDDFIPSGSRAAAAVEAVEARFGDNVSERTYVLLDGPLDEVPAANQLAALPELVSDVDAVRTAVGQPQVRTSLGLLPQLTAADPALADRLSQLGWVDGRFEPGADVPAVYQLIREQAPQRSAQFFGEGNRQLAVLGTTAGQSGAPQLADQLRAEMEPLRDAGISTRVTSRQLLFADTVDALTSSQLRSIAITVGAAAVLLLGYFTWRQRSPFLGAVAMVPTILVAVWVIGSMWVLGLSFNVLTISIGSIAIAVGIDYGIHIAHRFSEERDDRPADEGVRLTVERTGSALAGSAATTAAGFGVLVLSSIAPIRQFGIITALTIAYSIIAAVLILPAILHVRWGRSGAAR